jgi:phage terminase small subunit
MRQRRYVKARLSGQTKKEAALVAGYSEPMAENAAAKIESKEVRRAFQVLARKAVPPEKTSSVSPTLE